MFFLECQSDACLGLIPDPGDLPEHLLRPGVVSSLSIGDTGLIQCQTKPMSKCIALQVILDCGHLRFLVVSILSRTEIVLILLFLQGVLGDLREALLLLAPL